MEDRHTRTIQTPTLYYGGLYRDDLRRLLNCTRPEHTQQRRQKKKRRGEAAQNAEHDQSAEAGVGRHLRQGENAETQGHGDGIDKDGRSGRGDGVGERGLRIEPAFTCTAVALEKMDRIIDTDTQRHAGEHRRRHAQRYPNSPIAAKFTSTAYPHGSTQSIPHKSDRPMIVVTTRMQISYRRRDRT